MRDIYRNGMSDEVFAWTAASNNQAFVAGRLSVALNAISIARTAENSGNLALSDDTWLASIPRGPVMRLGNEHVMGVFVIWKFAKNKEAAKKYLVDQQLGYREHFIRSGYYNFPAWTGAIKGGFKEIRKMTAQDTHKPKGKYTVLTTIAEKYTTNPGHPGQHDPGDRRDLPDLAPPADVRRGRPGEVDPCRSGLCASRGRRRASTASGRTRGSCSSRSYHRASRAPATGPSTSMLHSRLWLIRDTSACCMNLGSLDRTRRSIHDVRSTTALPPLPWAAQAAGTCRARTFDRSDPAGGNVPGYFEVRLSALVWATARSSNARGSRGVSRGRRRTRTSPAARPTVRCERSAPLGPPPRRPH